MTGHAWDRNASTSKKNMRAEKKRSTRKPLPKPHETEEEAIIRRFHDAQRMARFRAKKKKAMEEAKMLKAAALTELDLISELKRRNIAYEIANSVIAASNSKQFQTHLYIENSPYIIQQSSGQSKYSQLLAVIEELGKDIRLTYAGSRTSIERLKTGIVQARMLVKDCLIETEINSR